MEKKEILKISKEGSNYEVVIPKDTKVEHINEGLALFIIDSAKFRGISSALALEEIRSWVAQLEDNQ